ncbi:YhgN family NAAT transporter [bacterium endosymbiont of Pedicinus badii]|uniref:YhgN family NAAT transporter n=1 Tax=bacterium endosymbiont of Pedicinus badii TaxID=1719126 RepID=UPI0009B984AC|nr:YhgN family NAAT transporter [bacterium endosymbiont of Pedicinus badii]OQM34089.1 antibiotic transporter [bacterium endosymbiont of Pedicinus badii]
MNNIMSFTILMFLIIDPIGNLPIFMSILKDMEQKKRNFIIFREMILALLAMFFFLFASKKILEILNLKSETISISGGIVLFIIAMKMIFPSKNGNAIGLKKGEEPFLVPLAIPLIAGPSILATLISLSQKYPKQILDLCISLLISWVLSLIVLMMSGTLFRILGKKGFSALEKIMGLLFVMISMQMILEGAKVYMNNY